MMLWVFCRCDDNSSKGTEQQVAAIGQIIVSNLQSSSCFTLVTAVRSSVHPRL